MLSSSSADSYMTMQQRSIQGPGARAPQRYKPPPIKLLAQRSKFSERELRLLYRGFKQDCPTGLVREEHLCSIFAQLFPFGNPAPFARIVFNWLDIDKRECLPFHQYVMWLSELARGSVDQKIALIFRLYDVDMDGTLSHAEIGQFLSSIYELLGAQTRGGGRGGGGGGGGGGRSSWREEAVQEHASSVFKQMDAQGKGGVDRDAFAHYCLCSVTIMKGFEALDTSW